MPLGDDGKVREGRHKPWRGDGRKEGGERERETGFSVERSSLIAVDLSGYRGVPLGDDGRL